MIIFMGIVFSAAMFLLGFLLGVLKKPHIKPFKATEATRNTLSISREYQNFLNYDGDEQE